MIRILMPSIVDPAVQLGGAWTMTRGLLRLLREGPLRAEVEVVAIRQRSRAAHRFRQCSAVARSLLTGLPAKIGFSRDRRTSCEVLRLLGRQRYDLVLLNGSDLLWLLPSLPSGTKRMLVAHNIEHLLFDAQLRWAARGLALRVLRRDHERLRRYEADGLRQVGQVIFLSSHD